jgi:SAUR family protein
MCNVITIPSVAWLRRAVRRWRARSSGSAAVPAGHVAVCADGARFVVRLAHLAHPAFLELLRQAEEEYGFPAGASGPVALSCDEHRLRDVLRRVSSSSSDGSDQRCRSRRRGGDQRPLLQGLAGEELVL